ncbi:MAG: orotidine-5'-phosphate decarboxylase [Phycisphaerae bacterium]
MADHHFADRLTQAIADKGTAACVGIDPVLSRLPEVIRCRCESEGSANAQATVDALVDFGRRIIQVVAPLVPAVKINSAFFEQYHWPGIRGYDDLVSHAKTSGLIVIGDVKRADIGHSSAAYAAAHLGDGPFEDLPGLQTPDAVTVNAYFGGDGVQPFVEQAKRRGKGVFALVQTSNESARQVQGLTLEGGLPLGEQMALLVSGWANDRDLIGQSGFSCLGAVVSPSGLEPTTRLRNLMPRCLFLVPGFGAQGRTVEQVRACFKPDGTGALVNASRSVIYAYQEPKYKQRGADAWERSVELACRDFVEALKPMTSA